MPAIITCARQQQQSIIQFLEDQLPECLKLIDDRSFCIKTTDTELHVLFPVGEIYGYTSDYVQCVGMLFERMKKAYPDIGIWGVAYEYATITANTFGPFFRCQPEDKELTITYQWQMCAQCGAILDGEATYNSSQWDFEEGNEECLCCPTCMLLYAATSGEASVEANASIKENVESDSLKSILWKRVCDNMEVYLPDFAANCERIQQALGADDIMDDKKSVLQEILQRIE